MSEVTERSVWQSKIVRLALILLVLGAVLVIVGVLTFVSYRSSRNKPLAVKVYPGAQQVSSEKLGEGQDHQQYISSDPVEQIEQFYSKQDDMTCERQYSTVVERPGQDPVREGYVFTRCRVDHSWLDITQYAVITIQPQVDANAAATGQVIIDIQRTWGD